LLYHSDRVVLRGRRDSKNQSYDKYIRTRPLQIERDNTVPSSRLNDRKPVEAELKADIKRGTTIARGDSEAGTKETKYVEDRAWRSKLFRPDYGDHGNPFHTRGEVRADAEIILTKWRQNRLSSLYEVIGEAECGQDVIETSGIRTSIITCSSDSDSIIDTDSRQQGSLNIKSSKDDKAMNHNDKDTIPKLEDKQNKFQLKPCCSVM